MKKCNYFIQSATEGDENPLIHKIIYKEKWYEVKERIFTWNLIRFLRFFYTPSFAFLCCIYDFIIFLENICMFRNDGSQGIQAYHNLKNGVKSFIIYAEKEHYTGENNNSAYTIEYTMFRDHSIHIKIKRSWGDKVVTNISFIGDEPMMLSESDQILFDSIISETMSVVSNIFSIYHKNVKPMKYNQSDSGDKFNHE